MLHPIVVAHRKNRQQSRLFRFQFLEPPSEKTALRFLPRQGERLLIRKHGPPYSALVCKTDPQGKNGELSVCPQFPSPIPPWLAHLCCTCQDAMIEERSHTACPDAPKCGAEEKASGCSGRDDRFLVVA